MTGEATCEGEEGKSITNKEDFKTGKERGFEGAICALWSLQDLGCEIDLRMPWTQEIIVAAPGNVRYWIEQVSSASGYKYRLGMELNGERTEAANRNNMPDSYSEAVSLLTKTIEHDPQNEVNPRPTHFRIEIN